MQTNTTNAEIIVQTQSGSRAATIASLNDAYRQRRMGNGRTVITQGVDAEGPEFIMRASRAVQSFDDFRPENDPHGEHDFGAFRIDGQKLFWKIDYYDQSLECGSEDPANPDVTTRVLTIMLASEY